jgi:hypothetical protein
VHDVPARALLALAEGYTLDVSADILSQGKVIASDVPVTGEPVAMARSGFARRTGSVTVLDLALAPDGNSGDVLALGNEIRLWRGMTSPVRWRVPLITGVITSPAVPYDVGGLPSGISVDIVDRCKRIADARFTDPVNLSGSAFVALTRLIQGAAGSNSLPLDIHGALRDVSLPLQTFQRKRDDAVKAIAAALGAEVEASAMGEIRVQPIPDPSGTPLFIAEGEQGGFLIDGTRTLSDDGVYNGIQATGVATGQGPIPQSPMITDDDPKSPTYWRGPFGQRPGFFDSSLLTTTEQAVRAAAAQLRNTVGVARSVSLNLIPNPALEVGDLIGVRWPDGRYEQHIIDSLSVPLDESSVMQASTRATQIIAAGVS